MRARTNTRIDHDTRRPQERPGGIQNNMDVGQAVLDPLRIAEVKDPVGGAEGFG